MHISILVFHAAYILIQDEDVTKLIFRFKELVMLLSRVLVISSLIFSSTAFAEGSGLDVNLNNNAAQFQFIAEASDLVEGNSALHAGYLYNDSGNMFVDAGLIVKGEGEEEAGPIIAMGVKAVLGTVDRTATALVAASRDTGSAIAVGGELGYMFPTAIPVGIVAEYYVAPKILAFADAERFNQFTIRLELVVSPQAKAYFGYREIGFGFKTTGSGVVDSGTFVGVALSF